MRSEEESEITEEREKITSADTVLRREIEKDDVAPSVTADR